MEQGVVLAGRYEVGERVGQGGMGQVWRGFDLQTEYPVAVKLLRDDEVSGELQERFRREAAMTARLRSPRVAAVYESGWHQGEFFIVMELLRGRDLGKIAAEHPAGMPAARVAELAVQLAGGLAVVHEKDIVHRDLKPANLFIEDGDQLKICDFGIARDYTTPSDLTIPGSVFGTPGYIAPELWKGQLAGPASDLYAVGCILYELLTGTLPFAGTPYPAVGFRHLNEAPVPPRDRNPGIPESLNRLTMALLAKDPADRPRSAAEVGAALRAIRTELGERVTVTAPVACLSRTPWHLQALVLNDADNLLRATYWPDRDWSPWSGMDGGLPGRAAAVAGGSHDDNQAEIAIAVGGTVHHQWWWQDQQGDHWSGWHDMPALGRPVTDLALTSMLTGHLELFALDSAGQIHHRWYRGDWFAEPGWIPGWHDMSSPGGKPVSALAAGSQANHHQELFVIADGAVWHRWHWRGSSWSRWAEMTGLDMHATDVACSSLMRTHIEVFAIDASGRLRHQYYWPEPEWSPWEDMPVPAGPPIRAITAGSHSGRQQDLLALTADGKLHHAENRLHAGSRSDWSRWREIPSLHGTR